VPLAPKIFVAAILFVKIFPLILVTLGLLPSVIWLMAYLREDVHPEPKRAIAKIFVWGMLVAPLAVLAQYLVLAMLDRWNVPSAALWSLFLLAGIEEYLKYLVVQTEIEDEPDFNEPTDAMVYLIVSALGFAAVENISIAFSLAPSGVIHGTEAATVNLLIALRVLGIRFLGATLLHAFASSIVGFTLAKRVFEHRGVWIIWEGLFIAVILHALFNYLILEGGEIRGAAVIAASAIMVSVIVALFKRLQKITRA